LVNLFSVIISNYCFRRDPKTQSKFRRLWPTKKFQLFVNYFLDEAYLLNKMRMGHEIKALPSDVRKALERINALRNARPWDRRKAITRGLSVRQETREALNPKRAITGPHRAAHWALTEQRREIMHRDVITLGKQVGRTDGARDERGRYLPKDRKTAIGRGSVYILLRLDRDGHSELAAKVRSGAMSANAAAVAAGFRKKPTPPPRLHHPRPAPARFG
jgi:hypothetical protein